MRFRNGTTAVIGLGNKVVGATRTGATPALGYVKPFGEDELEIVFSDLTTTLLNTIDGNITGDQGDDFRDAYFASYTINCKRAI